MLGQAIWWSSIALESLLLFRGFRGRLASRYPAFYFYIAFVLFQDVVCFAVARWTHSSDAYTSAYWTAEFLCVLVSCGIVFEIYRVGLAAFPGAARMARNLMGLVFVVVLIKLIVNIAKDPQWWTEASARGVEGTLRAIQGVAIVALIALFIFYSVPFGRNLRGILMGYGLFVCWSVVCLTLAPPTGRLHDILGFLYSALYPLFLVLWLVPLWSYQANAAPKRAIQLEQDYQRVAIATQRRLHEARSYVARAVGS